MQASAMKTLTNILILAIVFVAACSSNSNSDSSGLNSAGLDTPVAYVKRPLNSQSMNSSVGNPTDSVTFHQGGDLYMLAKSSASATETNITGALTNGQGDVSDPEASYDGKKIIFSMRCNVGSAKSCVDYRNDGTVDTTWNIWEYNIAANTVRRIITDTSESQKGDDVDPAYLPDGRIVFSSNRQQKSVQTLGYKYLDEYDRETSTVLHVMNADGTGIEQISFNQSHDRNPTVLMDGHIMYSRWDHVGGRNQFSIFRANLDGSNMFIHYGAHSGVVSYLHPREMQDGRVLSDAMPLSGTSEGGALLIIDPNNFSEVDQPGPSTTSGAQAQVQASFAEVDFGSMVSSTGRFTSPYPLWDGTNRALVTFTPGGRTEKQAQNNLITGVVETVDVEKTPAYGVYMLDLNTKRMRAIVLPNVNANGDPINFVTDPIALMPRSKPKILAASSVDAVRKSRNVASITVGSIYDTETARARMTEAVLSAQEKASGIVIPLKDNTQNICPDGSPRNPNCDTRKLVADITKLKDPSPATGTAPDKRPGRFARIVKAVPTPRGVSRETLGETEFEMQQILGYTEVEPDGSLAFEVPADVPFGISVVDSFGRALQTHTSWIQGRPGESVFCNGCHSPRKGSTSALNGADQTKNNNLLTLRLSNNTVTSGNSGEVMAQTRFNKEFAIDPNAVKPKLNLQYTDVWTPDPLTKGTPINITYGSLTTPAPGLASDGAIVVNFREHIQPILEKSCTTSCHGATGSAAQTMLDLSGSISGTGRIVSYDALMIGKPILENGVPRLVERDGEIVVDREEAMVVPGLARATALIRDWIFTEGLDRRQTAIAADRVNHPGMLNVSEKRVMAEWIDLGSQYYNDPCETRNGAGSCTKFRGVVGLSEAVFATRIQPLMLTDCAGCHVAVGRAAGDPPFQAKLLVLTGSTEGDFNVAAGMVNNVCNPSMSSLLRYPNSNGNQLAVPPEPIHPRVLDTTDPLYVEIVNWITAAQAGNGCP